MKNFALVNGLFFNSKTNENTLGMFPDVALVSVSVV